MALEEIHCWSLGEIIGSFIDLFLAYVLLCGATFALFASNLFRFFGLLLPCPCKGIFGYRNSNFCFHKVLFELPLKMICSIQVMAAKRFPFDLVWVKKGHSLDNTNDNKNVVDVNEKICDNNNNRMAELEDESSCSGPRLVSLVDRESMCDAKGKRIVSLKRRSGFRRRTRGSYDCGKNDSVIRCDNFQSDVAFTSSLLCDGSSSITKDRSSQSLNLASEKEVSVHYNEDDRTCHDMDEKTCHSYEFNASMVDSPRQEIYSSFLEHYTSTSQDNVKIVGNEDKRIKMLENALEEEKAAYASLYLELEKERAAAASAADEAMAMISRLQEEKALMEMEMRQYERIIEERVAYDEEEMNIMQEILIRREKENLFLEKELESYRQMGLTESCESNSKSAEVRLNEWKLKSPLSFETYDDPPQTESTILNVKEESEKNTEHKDQVCYDTESDVLDVHVIEDNTKHTEKEIENLSSSSCSTLSDKPTNTLLDFGSCPCTSNTENDNNIKDAKCKSLPFDSESDSLFSVHNEKVRIDNEIEILGERLRTVQHEKEKLTLFAEKGENEKGQLKLLEEIANRLQQIKHLRNPSRGASLPPSWPKVNNRKRRCQSVSWETCESC